MSTGSVALFVCALIGAVIGFYVRDKKIENSTLHSMLACTAGALLVVWLLARFIYAGLIFWPLYAVLGAALANVALRASQKSAENKE